MIKDYNICAAHAIKTVLDKSEKSKHQRLQDLDILVNDLKRESRRMLKEHSLTEKQTKISTEHTFNVEAISRVLRNVGYKTKYINVSLQDNIAPLMILSDGDHWISVISKRDFFSAYTDNQKRIFFGQGKSIKTWLKRKKFISGLEITPQNSI